MSAVEVNSVDLCFLLDGLSSMVDPTKDLPENVFFGSGYKFYFFERPLFSFVDVFCGLLYSSFSSFNSDVFVKFSGFEELPGLCYSINDVERDAEWIGRNSGSFFGGEASYPFIFFNRGYDWIAFESAYEEFGVIRISEEALSSDFGEYVNSNFVSSDELVALASGTSTDSIMAKKFVKSFL